MKTEIIKVTPSMAKTLLDSNGRNRRINPKVVARYARDMKDGNWELNGEAIVIDENGLLKNGQHRLSAVVLANTAVDMLVVTDVAATVDTYDKQYRRSTMNTFEMKGCGSHLKNPRVIGIARYAMDLERGEAMRTDAELLDYMLEHEDTLKELYQLICIGHNNPVSRIAPGTALYYALRSGVPYSILVRFCTILSNGFYQGASETAAVVIRNKLMTEKLTRRAEKKDMFLQTQMAIRDFTEGKPRQMLWAKAYGVYSDKIINKEG